MRRYFRLQLKICGNTVYLSMASHTLPHTSATMSRREFEQLVRSPRSFDYVQSVYINTLEGKYRVTEDGAGKSYDDPLGNSVISELLTWKFDLERRVRVRLGIEGAYQPQLATDPDGGIPQPTCVWAHPRTRVILGLDQRMMPPEIIGSMHSVPVVDRTHTVQFVTDKLKTDHPLPDFSVPEERSFETLMLERGEELWRWIEDENRPAVIWWSGGIDSTGVLVAMLRTHTVDRMKTVKIGLNQRSIDEYPDFYENVVKKLPTVWVSHNDGREVDLTSLHISGEIGDQLFGSDMIRACFGNGGRDFIGREFFLGNLRNPWRDTMSPFVQAHIDRNEWPAEFYGQIMDIYERLCAAAPIEIRSVFDFWWWSNFNLKYTHVANRIQLGTTQTATAVKRIKAFYDTDYFQKWSVANHDLKIEDSWKSYKKPLKRFVFDWNKDKEWFQNKTKVQSLSMYQDARNLIMDTRYQRFGLEAKEALLETYFGEANGNDS